VSLSLVAPPAQAAITNQVKAFVTDVPEEERPLPGQPANQNLFVRNGVARTLGVNGSGAAESSASAGRGGVRALGLAEIFASQNDVTAGASYQYSGSAFAKSVYDDLVVRYIGPNPPPQTNVQGQIRFSLAGQMTQGYVHDNAPFDGKLEGSGLVQVSATVGGGVRRTGQISSKTEYFPATGMVIRPDDVDDGVLDNEVRTFTVDTSLPVDQPVTVELTLLAQATTTFVVTNKGSAPWRVSMDSAAAFGGQAALTFAADGLVVEGLPEGYSVESASAGIKDNRYVPLDPPYLVADANGDGRVDVADLGTLATNYGLEKVGFGPAGGDFNGDGMVNVADLGILATNFNQPDDASFAEVLATYPAFQSAVPEPATLGLWAAAFAVLLRRRKA
jgi:hypothetical protein